MVGITSNGEKTESLHSKLEEFHQLQQRLQAGVFAALIQAGCTQAPPQVAGTIGHYILVHAIPVVNIPLVNIYSIGQYSIGQYSISTHDIIL